MDMRKTALGVLSRDAGALEEEREVRGGKKVGRVIAEVLAMAAMKGDLKAAQLLLEVAGEDAKSRVPQEKETRRDAPIILDVRPE